MFNVVIQLGAIMAVVVIYFDKLNPFSRKKDGRQKKETWSLWFKVIIATIPAMFAGLLFDQYLEDHFYNFVSVAVMLIIYGVAFIVVEKWAEKKKPTITSLSEITYRFAFGVGMAQLLSLMPGTSRSGVTILAAILMGGSRFIAAEFTFFLGIPVMFGASLLKSAKFIKGGNVLSGHEFMILLVASITAFIVSVIVIKFLMDYIKKHDFTIFGQYRIVLGIILIIYAILTKQV